MYPLYLLLGSNRGNRLQYINNAEKMLVATFGNAIAASSIYETAAWGNTHQPAFLNKALLFETNMLPQEILVTIKNIETDCGRVFSGKWNEREIDIDVLLLGNRVFNSETLTIPHTMLHLRKFALLPLAEIAANMVHPVFEKTIAELLAACSDTLEVNKFEPAHEV